MYPKREIIICLGSSCFARGNKDLLKVVQKFIRQKDLSDKVRFRGDHCFDMCSEGPNLKIGNKDYHNVSSANVIEYLLEGLKDLI